MPMWMDVRDYLAGEARSRRSIRWRRNTIRDAKISKKTTNKIAKKATKLVLTKGYRAFVKHVSQLRDQELAATKENNAKETALVPFRFLDLPGELRNQVYHLALVSAEKVRIKISGASFTGKRPYRIRTIDSPRNIGSSRNSGSSTNILLVNHQIQQEANSILWSARHFEIDSFHDLRRFLQVIGPERRSLLQKLTLRWEEERETRSQLRRSLRFLGECVDLSLLAIKYYPSIGPVHTSKLEVGDCRGRLSTLDRLTCFTLEIPSWVRPESGHLELENMLKQMGPSRVGLAVNMVLRA